MYLQMSGMAFDDGVAYVPEQATNWGERRPQGL